MVSNWDVLLRLLMAAVLGSAVGFERERLLWAAGIRTHMLVGVGSCLFMLVSAFGFADIKTEEHVVLDPSRIAAQVVSGIGFLGAGSILLRGQVIRGLTTAASIWSVAAIGLAVGGGLYFAAAASTAVILLILAGVKPLEEAYRDRNQSCRFRVTADRGALAAERLPARLGIRKGQLRRFVVTESEKGRDVVSIGLGRLSRGEIGRMTERLRGMPGVTDVEVVSRADSARGD